MTELDKLLTDMVLRRELIICITAAQAMQQQRTDYKCSNTTSKVVNCIYSLDHRLRNARQ